MSAVGCTPPFPTVFLPDALGQGVIGGPSVLADGDDDLVAHTGWNDAGFCLGNLPRAEQTHAQILAHVREWVTGRVRAQGLAVNGPLDLASYHRLPGLTPDLHRRIATWAVPLRDLGLDEGCLVAGMSEFLGLRLKLLRVQGATFEENCGLRLVRPRCADNNPFHRDGWLGTCKASVNAWIPVLNCTRGSSLRVLAGSHRWPESALLRTPGGARLGGQSFAVPAVIAVQHAVEPVEPLPQLGQFLMFSNYLIHGGGRNTHPDRTRVSIEVRFTRA